MRVLRSIEVDSESTDVGNTRLRRGGSAPDGVAVAVDVNPSNGVFPANFGTARTGSRDDRQAPNLGV